MTSLAKSAEPAKFVEAGGVRLDDATLGRRVIVKPGMSGHNALFVGQVGDWTWETVSAMCATDVFRARDAAGQPTYLAFYYIHVRCGRVLQPLRLSFGERIDVVSRVFGFGSESVLTVHRIAGSADGAPAPVSFDAVEPYERPREDCIYVESFNRWVARRRAGSNLDLVKASPEGFAHQHLPALPERHSPRRAYDAARTRHSFDPLAGPAAETFTVDYRIDVSRDVNAVGLIYFAAYFSIVDWALLRFWRHLGRDERSFMSRNLADQKICYLGNAETDTVLRIDLSLRRLPDCGHEAFDAVVRERETGRPIAVSTIRLRRRSGQGSGDDA